MPATIVITRPQAQAERFAADLQDAHGAPLPILIAPLMRITPVEPEVPLKTPDHVIFTSANAVAQVDRLGLARTATAWCVGQQTGEAAAAAGFKTEVSHGDAKALIAKIIDAGPAGDFLHLRGAHATGQVMEGLNEAGLPCTAAIVYAQEGQPPRAELIGALKGSDPLILPLFSPRSARLLGDAAEIRGNATVVAISDAVAKVTAAWPVKDTILSNSPDKKGMIAGTLSAFAAASDPKTP